MKENLKLMIVLVLGVLIGVLGFYALSLSLEEELVESEIVTNMESVDPSDNLEIEEIIEQIDESDLTDVEEESLLIMREEEKLARDVYYKLYEVWGQNIFKNISDSEQTHTDSVLDLLDRYEIEDPVGNNEFGVFENDELQGLYDDLVEQGSESLDEALQVGATIEDLDIYDLDEFMKDIDNEDILIVFENLKKGSRNHLRSFIRVIQRNGSNYEPQFITEELYENIINSASESGVIENL